jgi:hypothetical protein
MKGAEALREGVAHLEQLLLPRCQLGDRGVNALCEGLRVSRGNSGSGPTLQRLCVASNGLTQDACSALAAVISFHTVQRSANSWRHSLRGREPTESITTEARTRGLHALDLSNNPAIGDAGACELLHALEDDSSVTAISFQGCNMSSRSAATVAKVTASTLSPLTDLSARVRLAIGSPSLRCTLQLDSSTHARVTGPPGKRSQVG